METTTILLIILLAIGAIQGIVYGAILCTTTTVHKIANRFLAAILFFFSYRLIVEILHLFGLGRYDTWYYFLLELNWIYGALIYFFVVYYVQPRFKFTAKHLIHFVPVVIEIIWSFFIKTQNFYWDGTRESLSWLGYWGYVAWMHYPTMYVISGILIILYARKSLEVIQKPKNINGYERLNGKTNWIKKVIIALAVFSLLFTTITLIDFLFFDYAFNFFGYPIFIIMAFITYWLGLEGFSRRNSVAFKRIEQPSDKEFLQYETIAKKITHQMEHVQLFKDSTLTVAKLSSKVAEKPYLITKTLTYVFHTKFTDFINEYRFHEVKKLLNDSKNNKFTLLSLAFESGFNSKASFIRTVKKHTGKSPKHLKQDL